MINLLCGNKISEILFISSRICVHVAWLSTNKSKRANSLASQYDIQVKGDVVLTNLLLKLQSYVSHWGNENNFVSIQETSKIHNLNLVNFMRILVGTTTCESRSLALNSNWRLLDPSTRGQKSPRVLLIKITVHWLYGFDSSHS